MGWSEGGLKSLNSSPPPLRNTGLKSCPILAPPPFRSRKNPLRTKWKGASRAKLPNL